MSVTQWKYCTESTLFYALYKHKAIKPGCGAGICGQGRTTFNPKPPHLVH